MTDTSTPTSSDSSPVEADADSTGEEAKKSENVASDGDLFRQSEIAADYVEGLLDILDYDGDIDELVSAGRPMVEVVGGRLQPLVGQRGATLEALQELTRLAIFRATGSPSRLLLDIGGYRASSAARCNGSSRPPYVRRSRPARPASSAARRYAMARG